MTSVYILHFLKTKKTFYFTSIVAIYEAFSSEQLHVKYSTLNSHSFKRKPYRNMFIHIEKVKAFGKGDYEKFMDKFGKIGSEIEKNAL